MQKTEFRLSMFDCLELNDINGMPLLVGFNKKFRQNHSLEFLKNKFRGKQLRLVNRPNFFTAVKAPLHSCHQFSRFIVLQMRLRVRLGMAISKSCSVTSFGCQACKFYQTCPKTKQLVNKELLHVSKLQRVPRKETLSLFQYILFPLLWYQS